MSFKLNEEEMPDELDTPSGSEDDLHFDEIECGR